MNIPLTLADFLYRGATLYGDHIAVVDDPLGPDPLAPMTYAQLDRSVRSIATALAGQAPVEGCRPWPTARFGSTRSCPRCTPPSPTFWR